MTYFSFSCLAGGVARYSNDYYDFNEHLVEGGVSGLIQKGLQAGAEGEAREYIKSGYNRPCTVTIKIECATQKMGEIAKAYHENQYKYDTKGTLDIVEDTGLTWTFENAVLTMSPFEKTITITDEISSYNLVFECSQPTGESFS